MVERKRMTTGICSTSCNLWSEIVLIKVCWSSWGNFLVLEEQLCLYLLRQLWEAHLVLLELETSLSVKMILYHDDGHSQHAWHTLPPLFLFPRKWDNLVR